MYKSILKNHEGSVLPMKYGCKIGLRERRERLSKGKLYYYYVWEHSAIVLSVVMPNVLSISHYHGTVEPKFFARCLSISLNLVGRYIKL